MAWVKNGTPLTLTGTADDMDITDLSGSIFNQFLIYKTVTGGAGQVEVTYNNDGTSSYAQRRSADGGTDTTNVSQTNMRLDLTGDKDGFIVGYVIGKSTEEKLGIYFMMTPNTAGAGTAPSRFEIVNKWSDTSNTIDRIDSHNSGAGSYNTYSNISALGSDITPGAAVPFPTNVQVGSRAEITDTRKMYHYVENTNKIIDGSYTVLKFTEAGTFTPTSAFNVEYLVVAGGAGGGGSHGGNGGGGAAGGYRTNFGGTALGVTAQAYSITVGAGGGSASASAGATGVSGGDSVFDSITSSGGGGGSNHASGGTPNYGIAGGSGGGAGQAGSPSGAGTGGAGNTPSTSPSQGNSGGSTVMNVGNSGAGGGGSSAVGQASQGGGTGTGGSGGIGTSNSITGSAIYYAGGGGGATHSGTSNAGGVGGNGGGGNGKGVSNGVNATAGTNGLGGGAGSGGEGMAGTSGGSGVVIIRFLTSGNTYSSSLANSWVEEGT